MKVLQYIEGYLFQKEGGVDGPGVCCCYEGTDEYDSWYTGYGDAEDDEPPRIQFDGAVDDIAEALHAIGKSIGFFGKQQFSVPGAAKMTVYEMLTDLTRETVTAEQLSKLILAICEIYLPNHYREED